MQLVSLRQGALAAARMRAVAVAGALHLIQWAGEYQQRCQFRACREFQQASMPPRSAIRNARRKRSRGRRSWGSPLKRVLPSAQARRRWCGPSGVRRSVCRSALRWASRLSVSVGQLDLSGRTQTIRVVLPVSGTLYKSPPETWSEYASLFEKYSTDIMTPELLAALAQVEGSGNPIVRTYWRWCPGGLIPSRCTAPPRAPLACTS